MQVQTEKRTFMNNAPFGAFVNLISLDQEIRICHEKIAHLKQESETLLAQQQELTGRLEQFTQHITELQNMVKAQERILQDLDQQERAKKEQLDHMQDPKQYQPLKREIDRLKTEQNEKENYLLSVWNKLDSAQKEFEELQTQHATKLAELVQQVATKQDQIAQIEQDLEIKKQERPAQEIGVPDEWLEKYSHMRLRVVDPVVPVMQGSCGACSYAVTEQELIRLKRKALLQCKGCFRLLFMQEAMNRESADQ